jgi:sulfur-oxidizing protein SoxX
MKLANILPTALLLASVSSVGVISVAFAETVAPDAVKFEEESVNVSLTGAAGNVESGRKIFANRKQGNCLACHANKELSSQPFHGEVGPSLDGVADRYDAANLRGILVDSKIALSEDTIMPSFYRVKNGARTAKKFIGKTILSAEQVEDVLAYLQTLKDE